MPRRWSFERRLLLALMLFSLVPSLLLIGVGTYLLSEAVALHAPAATWERVAGSGRELLDLAEASGDPRLVEAAARHRMELSASLTQSGRWEYLTGRVLRVIPWLSLLLTAVLVWLAIRAAQSIARGLARPIRELVDWAGRVAREEPLPPREDEEPAGRGEFGVLREAFRTMAGELAASRARALEAERTRTWVVMARSVAHELKNSLTPLRLALRALERLGQERPEAREPLEVLKAESARLEQLARAFSQFGRLPEGPASEIDVVEQLHALLRSHLPPSVAFELRAPDDLPRLVGHHPALARAFSNLVLNAVEAMGEGGGTLEVEVRARGEMLEVRFRDTGPGIRAQHLDRIWEPEFTTKTRGTGLGLALVRQAVQAHGGRVGAGNHPGGGAEFVVELPLRGRAVSAPPSAVSPSEPAAATGADERLVPTGTRAPFDSAER